MANINFITTNFTAGELSPQIEGRVDLAKYQNGCATLNNVFVRVYGGAYRRPGTYLASVTKLSSAPVRVIPFEFSTTQAYMMEVGHQYIRFYKDSGVLSSGSPVEVTTAYSSGSIFHLQYAQDADTMYVTHSAHPPMKLSRSSHYLWSLAQVDFSGGPWMPSNLDSSAYIKSTSFSAGATLITTSGNTTFVAGHSGAYLRIGPSNGYVRLNSVSSLSAQATIINELYVEDFEGNFWMPDNTNSSAFVKSSSFSVGATVVTFSGNTTFVAGDSSSYLKIGNSSGYVKLNTVSSTSAQATVVRALESASATLLTPNWAHGAGIGTNDWSHGAWSVENGFPTAVTFFEQRLYFGGSAKEPQTLWGSTVLSYEDFTPGANDDNSVSFTIADNQVNAISWLAAGLYLAAGTAGGNFVLNTDTTSGPVTPTNINIKKGTTYGADLLLPKRIENAFVYLQRNNLTIRELKYSFEQDALIADDATILSEHITKSGIKDLEYQESPDGILWCVRKDGVMATMTRLAAQDVLAWTSHNTQGSYQSVAVIPNGNEDQVWVVAQRSSASVNAKYIEYFKPFIQPDAQRSQFYVDCGLSYESGSTAGVARVTGLDHLKGLTVSILGDGSVFPDQVVDTAGAVTISKSCSTIHVGLPYTSVIKTSRLEAGDVTGSSQGLVKRIYRSIIRMWRTLGCHVGVPGNQDIVMFRDSSMPMDVAPPLFTGDKTISFPAGWDKKAQVLITQAQPLPLNVLAIVSRIEISTE